MQTLKRPLMKSTASAEVPLPFDRGRTVEAGRSGCHARGQEARHGAVNPIRTLRHNLTPFCGPERGQGTFTRRPFLRLARRKVTGPRCLDSLTELERSWKARMSLMLLRGGSAYTITVGKMFQFKTKFSSVNMKCVGRFIVHTTLICLFNPFSCWLHSAHFCISFIPPSIVLNPPLSRAGESMRAHWVVSPKQMYSDQLCPVSMDFECIICTSLSQCVCESISQTEVYMSLRCSFNKHCELSI